MKHTTLKSAASRVKIEIIKKPKEYFRKKPNLEDYEKTYRTFDWKDAHKEIKWLDSRCSRLNMAYAAVDSQVETWRKNKVALYWESERENESKEFTFMQLSELSNKFANVLKSLDVNKRDRVFIFLPRVPKLYVSFLGILKTGAVAGTMFAAFGPSGIKDRLENSGAKIVITDDELKKRIYRVKRELPDLKHMIVVGKTGETKGWERNYEKEMAKVTEKFKVARTKPTDDAFILYTSGTTGKPKGVVHAHKALIQEHMTAKWALDLHEDDVYWCVPSDTIVITNPDPRRIEDITIGDKVLTHDGRYYNVLQTFKRIYRGDLIKIKTYYSNIPMYVTPNHSILVARDGKNIEWVPAEKLKRKDFVLFPILKEVQDIDKIHISDILDGYEVREGFICGKKIKTKIRDEIKIDNNFMRLIGYYLSEGSIGAKGHLVQLSFGKHESTFAEDVKNLFKLVFGLDVKTFFIKNTIDIRVNSTIIVKFLERLFGKVSEEKRLPSWIFHLPEKKLQELMKAFWRGDGDTERDGFRLCTTSPTLAYQFKIILNKLGIIVSFMVTPREKIMNSKIGKRIIRAKHDCYYLRIRGKCLEKMEQILNQSHPFTKSRKTTYQFGRIHDNFVWSPIRFIERVPYSGEVYNLKTEDNSYTLNNMTVHNCTADPGWVTGVAYGILGSWSNGASSVIYEGRFDPAKWYSILDKYNITVWYTAPTAIRMLMAAGDELVKKYNLSNLRHICSVGEPLNPEAVRWSMKALGIPFHDNWWQTETGGILISNYPCMPIKPGSMGKPLPGITAAIVDDKGKRLKLYQEGNLAIKPGWPSMMKKIWRRQKKYKSYFVGGWYITGDLAFVDKDGYFWFIGRADDVIKTAGERVGPFEVESALIEHPAVVEAGVIGKPDPIRGEIIKAFIVLSKHYKPSKKLEEQLKSFVKKNLAGHAYPREVEFVDSLPKTRSGKIIRRILKAKELGLPIGDTSTLEEY